MKLSIAILNMEQYFKELQDSKLDNWIILGNHKKLISISGMHGTLPLQIWIPHLNSS